MGYRYEEDTNTESDQESGLHIVALCNINTFRRPDFWRLWLLVTCLRNLKETQGQLMSHEIYD